MRRVPLSIAVLALLSVTVLATATVGTSPVPPPAPRLLATPQPPIADTSSVLESSLLVTWYGNPWSGRMGILGRLDDAALADGLKKQAAAYQAVTKKRVIPAYELVAIIGQPQPGRDGRYRRRESY